MAVILDNQNNKIFVNGIEIADENGLIGISSDKVVVDPYGTISATDLQAALEQLADRNYSTNVEPTTNLLPGALWYNTDTSQFEVYRETSPGIFQWVPIMIGNISENSDTLDAGSF